MFLEEPAIINVIKHHPTPPGIETDIAKVVYNQW